MRDLLIGKFTEVYKDGGDIRAYFAPGRVNLIGEHTDYNGGHVFPCALSIGIFAVARKRDDRKLRFYSANYPDLGIVESSLDDLNPDSAWTDYPKGVIWAFDKRGLKPDKGLDVLIDSNIPSGSGLSSSAAFEVVTGFMLRDLYGFDLDNIELAKIGQYSENNFNKMNCGIMDQFASAMGKKDSAIFLDTATLEYEYAPISLEDMSIIVTNSKVKHSLVGSAYNDRRASCEKALLELQSKKDIKTLGDLDEREFEEIKNAIKDEDRQRKAKHAVYENQRTIKAAKALKNDDIVLFGKLMNESHISLRDDYDVSCPEIDLLVETAWKVEGVLGSRITGGGFGGCTVSIVKDPAIEDFKEKLTGAYKDQYDMVPDFYVVSIGDGPRRL